MNIKPLLNNSFNTSLTDYNDTGSVCLLLYYGIYLILRTSQEDFPSKRQTTGKI